MFFRTNVSPLPFRFPLCLFSLPHACPLSIHGAPAPPPYTPASFSSLPTSAPHPNLCPPRPRPRDQDGEARQASRGGSSHTLASAPKSGTRMPIGCRHSGHAVTDEEAHVCRLQKVCPHWSATAVPGARGSKQQVPSRARPPLPRLP